MLGCSGGSGGSDSPASPAATENPASSKEVVTFTVTEKEFVLNNGTVKPDFIQFYASPDQDVDISKWESITPNGDLSFWKENLGKISKNEKFPLQPETLGVNKIEGTWEFHFVGSLQDSSETSFDITVPYTVGSDTTDPGSENENEQEEDNENSKVKKLTMFEEALSGKWSRYHRYDGSTQYWIFNADRTGCDWEENEGSSSRKSKTTYYYWELKDRGNNIFSVCYKTSPDGSLYESNTEFHYVDDELWYGGSSKLVARPSTTSKVCE